MDKLYCLDPCTLKPSNKLSLTCTESRDFLVRSVTRPDSLLRLSEHPAIKDTARLGGAEKECLVMVLCRPSTVNCLSMMLKKLPVGKTVHNSGRGLTLSYCGNQGDTTAIKSNQIMRTEGTELGKSSNGLSRPRTE